MRLSEILWKKRWKSWLATNNLKSPTWFKPGDRVKCITNFNNDYLVEGKKYIVKQYTKGLLKTMKHYPLNVGFFHARFQKVDN